LLLIGVPKCTTFCAVKNLQKQGFLVHFLRQKSAFFSVLMQKMRQKHVFLSVFEG
jgi:hypothetical protein